MLVYHGSNQELGELAVDSWITSDLDVAWDFAVEKVSALGGSPVVMALEIDEDDVDWDVLSMLAGVEDERGVLVRAMPASVLPRVGSGLSL